MMFCKVGETDWEKLWKAREKWDYDEWKDRDGI